MKVYSYDVFLFYIIYYLLIYFMTILTPFFFRFVVSLSPGESIPGSIFQKDLSWKSTRIQMNIVGQSCPYIVLIRHAMIHQPVL